MPQPAPFFRPHLSPYPKSPEHAAGCPTGLPSPGSCVTRLSAFMPEQKGPRLGESGVSPDLPSPGVLHYQAACTCAGAKSTQAGRAWVLARLPIPPRNYATRLPALGPEQNSPKLGAPKALLGSPTPGSYAMWLPILLPKQKAPRPWLHFLMTTITLT